MSTVATPRARIRNVSQKQPRIVRLITLPSGHQVTLREYVNAWRQVKISEPGTEFPDWCWYPVTREFILADIRRGIDDRINQRGGLTIREHSAKRIQRQLCERVADGRLVLECRNCCNHLAEYRQREMRFCCGACRGDYYR